MSASPGDLSLFRPQALSHSAGDDYDHALRVLLPRARAAGLILMVVMVSALVWSALTKVPVNIAGRGILVTADGVVDVVAAQSGRLADLLVRPGDRVADGAMVARLEQADLQLELDLARAALVDADDQERRIGAFQENDIAASQAFATARDAALAQSLTLSTERLRLMSEREQVMRDLASRSLINRERELSARIDVFNVREAIARSENERRALVLEEALKQTTRDRERLALALKSEELRRKVAALEQRLARVSAVTAPQGGIVVEIKAHVGQMTPAGASLFTILRDSGPRAAGPGESVAPATGPLVALLYVPPRDGKKLRPGMQVEVTPATVLREEHGFVLGQVRRIAEFPSSTAGMTRTLQNDQLVATLAGDGAPYEVEVGLEADSTVPSGLRWSSGRGPAFAVNSGTLCEARIAVRQVRLLGLAIPAFQGAVDATGEDRR